jgi:hypothetical protein
MPGQAYLFSPTVVSGGPAGISFSIQNKPSWATFSIATGQLSGTPTNANVGSYANVVISASDAGTTAQLPPFTITVTGGGAVTLAWQVPTANTDGTPLTNLAGYVINYGQSASVLNRSVNIGTPSTINYTVSSLSAGVWYFAISAYTSDGSESSLSNVVSTTVE